MLDATKPNVHRDLLTAELESVGIRLNKRKPNIYFKIKKGGGLSFNSTLALTKCSEKMVQTILHSFKMFNAEVLFREDATTEEFIDVVLANRVYLPCICKCRNLRNRMHVPNLLALSFRRLQQDRSNIY